MVEIFGLRKSFVRVLFKSEGPEVSEVSEEAAEWGILGYL